MGASSARNICSLEERSSVTKSAISTACSMSSIINPPFLLNRLITQVLLSIPPPTPRKKRHIYKEVSAASFNRKTPDIPLTTKSKSFFCKSNPSTAGIDGFGRYCIYLRNVSVKVANFITPSKCLKS